MLRRNHCDVGPRASLLQAVVLLALAAGLAALVVQEPQNSRLSAASVADYSPLSWRNQRAHAVPVSL